MKFTETIKPMKEGKKAKCDAMNDKCHVYLKGNVIYHTHFDGSTTVVASDTLSMWLVDDIHDWQIVEEKKTLSDKATQFDLLTLFKHIDKDIPRFERRYKEQDLKDTMQRIIHRIDETHTNEITKEVYLSIIKEELGEQLTPGGKT
jgi:hypothetical protein